MKSIHIENSYKVWSTLTMWTMINEECAVKYEALFADDVLNRSNEGMYLEWYLHNIGYWLTLPFIKNEKFKALNERFKHVDLEEHK